MKHVLRELLFPLRVQHEGTPADNPAGAARQALAISGRYSPAEWMKAIEIGGMPDHVHILLSLPSTLSIAKAIPLIRAKAEWATNL
jgi:hypothetical protein